MWLLELIQKHLSEDMTMYETYSTVLCHHGILGMHWGIRRYQNKDGSLTAAGEKRYNTDSDKKELSPEEKQRQTLKKVAIGAGVAAVALAGIAAYRIYDRDYKDYVVKGEQAIQRISKMEEKGKLNSTFYGAFTKGDMSRYEKLMPHHYDEREAGDHLKKIIKSKDAIKLASEKHSEKVFKELIKKDPEFAKEVGSKSYKYFNKGLVDNYDKASTKKFYDALKSKGYGGLLDVNDKKMSGFNTKAPAIFFNSDKMKIVSETKIDHNFDKNYKTYTDELIKAYSTKNLSDMMDTYIQAGVIGSGTAAVAAGVGAHATKKGKKND